MILLWRCEQGGEEVRGRARSDLCWTFCREILSLSFRYCMSGINRHSVMSFLFDLWPFDTSRDTTSSKDQISYIFAQQCLISAARKSPWRELTFCVRFTSCKAGMCCSCWEMWGRGRCLEPRGVKLLVSLQFWQIAECKWFPLKCGWMVPGLPFHMMLFPFPRVSLAKQRKCPNPMTLLFSLEYKWLLDTLLFVGEGGQKWSLSCLRKSLSGGIC